MPPRPSRETIRYRSTRSVPGENPPLAGGREPGVAGFGTTAIVSGSRVGVSRIGRDRPQVAQNRMFSEHTAPQPEQVTMRTDCIAPRGVKVKVDDGGRPAVADRPELCRLSRSGAGKRRFGRWQMKQPMQSRGQLFLFHLFWKLLR